MGKTEACRGREVFTAVPQADRRRHGQKVNDKRDEKNKSGHKGVCFSMIFQEIHKHPGLGVNAWFWLSDRERYFAVISIQKYNLEPYVVVFYLPRVVSEKPKVAF
jgi:phage gp16-like protein